MIKPLQALFAKGTLVNKKIIIHFGPPKTGTSAIQFWLKSHTLILAEHHIYYPSHLIDKNNVSSGNVDAIFSNLSGKLSLDKQKASKLLYNFEKGPYQILLLSSEHFFFNLPELVEFFKTATFIGYIRSPLEYFESSYNQSIKRHGDSQTIALKPRVNGNYLRRIGHALDAAGEERFHLRGYSKAVLKENDVIADFLSYLQLVKVEDSNNIINSSYCFEALELMRWLNQFKLTEFISDIDTVLQKYEAGTQHFSVVPIQDYNRYKIQSIRQVEDFCKKHQVVNSGELINHLKDQKQSLFLEQKIDIKQAEKIVTFILINKGQNFFNLLSNTIHEQFNASNFNPDILLLFPKPYANRRVMCSIRDVIRADLQIKNKFIFLMCSTKKLLFNFFAISKK
jgi:hypothetical protein